MAKVPPPANQPHVQHSWLSIVSAFPDVKNYKLSSVQKRIFPEDIHVTAARVSWFKENCVVVAAYINHTKILYYPIPHVYIYIYIHKCIYTYKHSTYTYIQHYTCTSIYTYTYIYVQVQIYVSTCLHTCRHTYIYICTYT